MPDYKYRRSPDSTVFVHPENRTIEKTVLIGDWFSTKSVINTFWIFKVPFFLLIFILFCLIEVILDWFLPIKEQKNHPIMNYKPIFKNIIGIFPRFGRFLKKKFVISFFKLLYFSIFFHFLKVFLLKIGKTVLNRGICTIQYDLKPYYSGDCTKWNRTKWELPVLQ